MTPSQRAVIFNHEEEMNTPFAVKFGFWKEAIRLENAGFSYDRSMDAYAWGLPGREELQVIVRIDYTMGTGKIRNRIDKALEAQSLHQVLRFCP